MKRNRRLFPPSLSFCLILSNLIPLSGVTVFLLLGDVSADFPSLPSTCKIFRVIGPEELLILPSPSLVIFFFKTFLDAGGWGQPRGRQQVWPIPFLTLWGHLPSGNSLPPSVFLLFLLKKKKRN